MRDTRVDTFVSSIKRLVSKTENYKIFGKALSTCVGSKTSPNSSVTPIIDHQQFGQSYEGSENSLPGYEEIQLRPPLDQNQQELVQSWKSSESSLPEYENLPLGAEEVPNEAFNHPAEEEDVPANLRLDPIRRKQSCQGRINRKQVFYDYNGDFAQFLTTPTIVQENIDINRNAIIFLEYNGDIKKSVENICLPKINQKKIFNEYSGDLTKVDINLNNIIFHEYNGHVEKSVKDPCLPKINRKKLFNEYNDDLTKVFSQLHSVQVTSPAVAETTRTSPTYFDINQNEIKFSSEKNQDTRLSEYNANFPEPTPGPSLSPPKQSVLLPSQSHAGILSNLSSLVQKVEANDSATENLSFLDHVDDITQIKAGLLTREVLNSIHMINQVRELQPLINSKPCLDCDQVPNIGKDNSPDKFVVNLFESRQSKRWKRKSAIKSFNLNKPAPMIIETPKQDNNHNDNNNHTMEYVQGNKEELFQKLRKQRDVECTKLHQASNLLKAIKQRSNEDCLDVLLPEKILLESDLRVKVLIEQMRDLGYSEPKNIHTSIGAMTISGFSFGLKPLITKSKNQEFYVVLLTHNAEVQASKIITSDGKTITVEEVFKFENIEATFDIKAQVYSIELEVSKKTCSLRRKKSKAPRPMSKIYYENVNTFEMNEGNVMKTSFKLVGEMTITKEHLNSDAPYLLKKKPEDSHLEDEVSFKLDLEEVGITSQLSGFLTMGKKIDDYIYWERKWCVLRNTVIQVYNYPQQEDFVAPAAVIDLKCCLGQVNSNPSNCAKYRTFALSATGAEGKKKTHFFNADCEVDFKEWTEELCSILRALKDWRSLFFKEDSC